MNQLVHGKQIYDYQSMIGLVENKVDKLIPKIVVPRRFNFWHFSLEYVIGEDIDNGCVRHVNWKELQDRENPAWVNEILEIAVDCFGDKTYKVYIGW